MHTQVRDKAFLNVVGNDVRVEQVATGFGFTEGPGVGQSAQAAHLERHDARSHALVEARSGACRLIASRATRRTGTRTTRKAGS